MPEEFYTSPKRARLYKRKLDYDDIKRRVEAGESRHAIARSLGVRHGAIQYALKRVAEKGAEVFDPLKHIRLPVGYVRCPTCQGPKMRASRLCFTCTQDHRLAPTRVERLPGQKRVILAGLEPGRIVKCRDGYGVVERIFGRPKERLIDFWDRPAEVVPDTEIVDVESHLVTFVDDVRESSEEIHAN